MRLKFINMDIDKFLKKVAEEDRESLINDKDIEFLASIGVDYNKKRIAAQNEPPASYYLTAKPFNYRVLWVCLAIFIVVVITVSIILYSYFKPNLVEPPIQYFEGNFVKVDSDIDELNADLELFSLVVNENDYDLLIEKTYDSLSGDTLYYRLNISLQNGKLFKLDIVVNRLYEYKQFSFDREPVETKISGYTLKYVEDIEEMFPPLTKVTGKGEMRIGEQWIYIEKFEEMTLGQSTFIETLQSIISFK